jgi:ribonuclease P protein component
MRVVPKAASVWRSDAAFVGFADTQLLPAATMLAALCERADFERLLAQKPLARSAHFLVHHVVAAPPRARESVSGVTDALESTELSTSAEQNLTRPVDNSQPDTRSNLGMPVHKLGCMLPKKHAKRAVTRNLVRRQIREAFVQRTNALPAGLWLVRLRLGWPVAQWPSASSAVLRRAVRAEVADLLGQALAASRGKSGVVRSRSDP